RLCAFARNQTAWTSFSQMRKGAKFAKTLLEAAQFLCGARTDDQCRNGEWTISNWSSMKTIWRLFTIIACAVISLSCNSCSTVLTRKSAITIYVTNEASGDLSVIDAANNEVIATLPLGKRPRGIQITPDRKNIFVALSGS